MHVWAQSSLTSNYSKKCSCHFSSKLQAFASFSCWHFNSWPFELNEIMKYKNKCNNCPTIAGLVRKDIFVSFVSCCVFYNCSRSPFSWECSTYFIFINNRENSFNLHLSNQSMQIIVFNRKKKHFYSFGNVMKHVDGFYDTYTSSGV